MQSFKGWFEPIFVRNPVVSNVCFEFAEEDLLETWLIRSLSHDISYASSCIFDDNMQLRNDIRQGIKGGDW